MGSTLWGIVRANLFTRFNAILGTLLVVIALVGPPQDGLFVVVPALNTVIGIAQELRAKRTLARLAVLTAPLAHVLREGAVVDLPVSQVAADYVLEIRPGDQIVADGVVLVSEGLQVDESLVTGEAEAADKAVGDQVLSGTFVVAGIATMRATQVGASAYAQGLEAEARRPKRASSELQAGTNRILRGVTWAMVPASVLLVTSQMLRSGEPLESALRGSVAGVGAMVPEGLVLLTSIALALGALRMARSRVLVQTLPAVEVLARVDLLCIDKTGTLTEPAMRVHDVESLTGEELLPILGAMAAADHAPNPTMRALAQMGSAAPEWKLAEAVPFSSARRWSAAGFGTRGAWVLGAADVLLNGARPTGSLAARLARHADAGRRVVLLSRAPGGLVGNDLPPGLVPAGLVALEEELRPEATSTVGYLLAQGIEIKVLSGDDPRTVAAIAKRVGIPVADGVDASQLPTGQEALIEALGSSSVFGRVSPHRKRAMVSALQSAGHVVAMIGDGVNDVAALRQADIGIAMGSGSQASRAVGQVVLLDSSFAAVPQLLYEGRRVIDNIERVARVVVTKTVYATVLAVTVGVLAVPYPFYPRHLTLVSSLTIGIPGFFLALGRRAPLARSGFTRRVLGVAGPAGLAGAGAALGAFEVARAIPGTTAEEARTAAATALFLVGLWLLGYLVWPLTWVRAGLLVAMVMLALGAVWLPLSRHLFGLSLPPPYVVLEVAGLAAVAIGATLLLLQMEPRGWLGGRRHDPAAPSHPATPTGGGHG